MNQPYLPWVQIRYHKKFGIYHKKFGRYHKTFGRYHKKFGTDNQTNVQVQYIRFKFLASCFFTEKSEIEYFRFKHPLYITEFIVFFFEQLIILCVCFYQWIISGVKKCQLYEKNRTIRPGKRIFMSLWKTQCICTIMPGKDYTDRTEEVLTP